MRHVLPHILPLAVVMGSLTVAGAILIEASLSYLGNSGAPVSWGAMLQEDLTFMDSQPRLLLLPGLAMRRSGTRVHPCSPMRSERSGPSTPRTHVSRPRWASSASEGRDMNVSDRVRDRLSRIVVVIAVVLIGTVVAGYARLSQSGRPSRTVSIAFDSDIPTLDPAVGYDTQSEAVERLIFDQLVTYDSGTRLEYRSLPKDMPNVSADGRTYTFQLREGAQFVRGDGSPLRAVTAGDVAASFNRYLNYAHLLPYKSLVPDSFIANIVGATDMRSGLTEQVSGITLVDDHTVRFQLLQPGPPFLLSSLATPFASIVPAEIAGTDTTAFSEAPVGSGPFVLHRNRMSQANP